MIPAADVSAAQPSQDRLRITDLLRNQRTLAPAPGRGRGGTITTRRRRSRANPSPRVATRGLSSPYNSPRVAGITPVAPAPEARRHVVRTDPGDRGRQRPGRRLLGAAGGPAPLVRGPVRRRGPAGRRPGD